MIFRARHLPEDRLFECYLAEQGGEPLEPPAAEHLSDCHECSTRYGDLRRFMDGLRSEADAALDEIFTPEQWRAQQQSIARRLELLAHPARIISFPTQSASRSTAAAPPPHVAPRWLGMAAAAGLVIGVGAGSWIYTRVPGSGPASLPVRSLAPIESPMIATSGIPSGAAVTDVNDQFLSELELALERPHTQELVALDELTPHVRGISAQLR